MFMVGIEEERCREILCRDRGVFYVSCENNVGLEPGSSYEVMGEVGFGYI